MRTLWCPGGLPETIGKVFRKKRNSGEFQGPPGTATEYRRLGSPLCIKRTFLPKVAIPLQRGANFRFLDFGTPLREVNFTDFL